MTVRLKFSDDALFSRAGIDLAQHRAPPTLTRNFENSFGGVTVSKDVEFSPFCWRQRELRD